MMRLHYHGRSKCQPVAAIAVTLAAVAALAAGRATAKAADDANGKAVSIGSSGKLVYGVQADGDAIPDFSNCGYGGGGVAIPTAAAKVTLEPIAGDADDTPRLQAAIDRVSAMAADADGFRGAVLLKRGKYRVPGTLSIKTSGVVLRGEGQGVADGTVILATGTKNRAVITVGGTTGSIEIADADEPGKVEIRPMKDAQAIVDARVPVGARQVTVADASAYAVGDTVLVSRAGNEAWISFIGMDKIPPRPAKDKENQTVQWQPFSIYFDRVVTAVDGGRITLDAPLSCAIESKWGGGSIAKYDNAGRIHKVGVENMRFISDYDASVKKKLKEYEYLADEAHAGRAVSLDNVEHAWVRDVTTEYMINGVAYMKRGAKWVTVQDCTALKPVSVITGGRRYPFNIDGQLCLVQRCKAEHARHAFAFGSRVPGPNVYLDCVATDNHGASEPHHRWSVGGLYDNVDANVSIMDRGNMGTGHGWAGANYVVWNGRGQLVAQVPPTANTWVVGFVGDVRNGAFERPNAQGESMGNPVEPRSLYLKQVEERLGKSAVQNLAASRPG